MAKERQFHKESVADTDAKEKQPKKTVAGVYDIIEIGEGKDAKEKIILGFKGKNSSRVIVADVIESVDDNDEQEVKFDDSKTESIKTSFLKSMYKKKGVILEFNTSSVNELNPDVKKEEDLPSLPLKASPDFYNSLKESAENKGGEKKNSNIELREQASDTNVYSKAEGLTIEKTPQETFDEWKAERKAQSKNIYFKGRKYMPFPYGQEFTKVTENGTIFITPEQLKPGETFESAKQEIGLSEFLEIFSEKDKTSSENKKDRPKIKEQESKIEKMPDIELGDVLLRKDGFNYEITGFDSDRSIVFLRKLNVEGNKIGGELEFKIQALELNSKNGLFKKAQKDILQIEQPDKLEPQQKSSKEPAPVLEKGAKRTPHSSFEPETAEVLEDVMRKPVEPEKFDEIKNELEYQADAKRKESDLDARIKEAEKEIEKKARSLQEGSYFYLLAKRKNAEKDKKRFGELKSELEKLEKEHTEERLEKELPEGEKNNEAAYEQKDEWQEKIESAKNSLRAKYEWFKNLAKDKQVQNYAFSFLKGLTAIGIAFIGVGALLGYYWIRHHIHNIIQIATKKRPQSKNR